MGDPRQTVKQYTIPRRPWEKTLLEEERELMKTYGLKNKRELRKVKSLLTKKRNTAREVQALSGELRAKKESELIGSLRKIGVFHGEATLDDILGLTVKDLLERRLQTILWRRNLAKTTKQARQFITHGHIAISGKKVDVPGYIVTTKEQNDIGYLGQALQLEPPKTEKTPTLKETFEEMAPKEELEKKEEVTEEPKEEKKEEGATNE